MRTTVHVGDCRDVMRSMEPQSFTAIVSDPPYGLSFMGREWDHGVPGVEFWTEALRVLKPGGVLLAFGGSRTYHRLTCAIEDAGFEIRDCLSWLYGSGFPKSFNISKAMDRHRDDVAEVRVVCRWLRQEMESARVTSRDIARVFGFNPRMADHWAARDTDSQPTVPKVEQFDRLLEALGWPLVPDDIRALVWTLNGRKGSPGEAWGRRQVVGTRVVLDTSKVRPGISIAAQDVEGNPRREIELTRAASAESRAWEGQGTALKPAWEPVILAMKPLDGTFAKNAQRHGVAGLNVEGCRVDKRFPANVALDEEAAAILDEQAGDCGAAAPVRGSEGSPANDGTRTGGARARVPGVFHGDTGGASRFFYTSKAGTAERHGSNGAGGRATTNTHPTVKPLDLMQWLCRLVRMPKGTRILDPFCGSGSTLIAAAREGLDSVGIELDPASAEIARARFVGDAPMFNRCDVVPLEPQGREPETSA